MTRYSQYNKGKILRVPNHPSFYGSSIPSTSNRLDPNVLPSQTEVFEWKDHSLSERERVNSS